jgi:hypothetical protein
MDPKTMSDAFNFLVGQLITVINTQSYVRTLTGYTVDVETYKAKVVSYEDETLKILTEYVKDPRTKTKEKVYQFIPLTQIKRVTISPSEKFLAI